MVSDESSCPCSGLLSGTAKSSPASQPEVSIQNVLLSPCACSALTVSDTACDNRRCSRFEGVKGVNRKIGRVEGAEL